MPGPTKKRSARKPRAKVPAKGSPGYREAYMNALRAGKVRDPLFTRRKERRTQTKR